jgi:chemotaxis protein MotB
MKRLGLLVLLSVLVSSCVSSKIHKDLQSRFETVEDENTQLRKANETLSADLSAAETRLKNLSQELSTLQKEHKQATEKLSSLETKYKALNQSYEYLLENNNALLASNQKENKQLVEKLNKLQGELGSKEDSLRTEQNRLEFLSQQLQEREARVYELESLMARQDSTVNMVRKRLKDALLNFDGKGLTVEIRKGKVYVSLENSLLFPSASWTVQKEGKTALNELAKVLAENPDLNVMVEGHTDADAYNGSTAVKDNWDLSVMRATSIVKIITDNKGVNKANITAAGRSEYAPIATNETTEGKAINRRTEIIITPDLSELSSLLDETKK